VNRRDFLRGGCALGLSAYGGGLGAATDWLDLPARRSPRASTRLLLALARTSEAADAGLLAAGQRGIILASADQGLSWHQAPTPVHVTLTALCVAGGRAFAAGYDGVVLGSPDLGRTWTRLIDGRAGNALTLAAAERRFHASKKDEDARHALDDIRATLEFGPVNPLFGIAAQVGDDGGTVIAVGAFGQVFRSRDGGARWESLLDRLDNSDNLHHNAVTLTRAGAWVVTSEGGRIYVSKDAGESWRRVDTGYAGTLFGAVQAPGDGQALWAHGFAGSLFASRDQGGSWQALPSLGRLPLVASARNAAGQVAIVSLNGVTHLADGARWRVLRDRAPGLAAAVCADGAGWIVAGSKGVRRLSGETQA
jgi:photosystem II stability/assembly factor-like uncharacterized protein